MTAGFDVIIVSHNTSEDLQRCLTALQKNRPRRLERVLVVDNGSSDGSPDLARNAWPDVTLVALAENRGFAAANNIALRQSTAPLALLLNSDTIVPPGALDTLAERLEAMVAVAAGPRLVDARGRPEVSFGPMLSPWSELIQRSRVRMAASDGALARRYIASLVSVERNVDWVSGACLLVRRQSAIDVGLLDERFFMYEEDVDFCAALRAAGGRILFTPRSEVVHLRGRSVAQSRANLRSIYDRSHLAFYEKHLPRWAPVLRWWIKRRSRNGRS